MGSAHLLDTDPGCRPPRQTPWMETPPGRLPGCRPSPGTPPRQTPLMPPLVGQTPPDMSMSRWHTSHWNAHSFIIFYPTAVADPGFPQGGGANSPGGHQHTILPNFSKNCMKLKEFGPQGGAHPKFYYVDPPLNWKLFVPLLSSLLLTKLLGLSKQIVCMKKELVDLSEKDTRL